jgi:hypothetical protein
LSRSTASAIARRRAQGDLVRRVAADRRVVHIEIAHRDIRARVADHRDALFGQVGRDLAARCGGSDELAGHLLDQVGLTAQKGQPAGLAFLNDRDLDAVDQGQAPTLQGGHLGGETRVVRGRRLLVADLAVAGVLREDDA